MIFYAGKKKEKETFIFFSEGEYFRVMQRMSSGKKKTEIIYTQKIWQVYPNLTVISFKMFKVKATAFIFSLEVLHPVFPLPTDAADFFLKYLSILKVKSGNTLFSVIRVPQFPKNHE